MIGIVFATAREARPLLQSLGVISTDKLRVPAFISISNPDIIVCICGMGPELAGKGVAQLVKNYPVTQIINAGIAGALNNKFILGQLVQVSVAVSWPHISIYPIELNSATELPSAILITSPVPVFDTDLREEMAKSGDIVDMEGAEIARVCAEAGKKCSAIKAISDFARENERARLFENLDRLAGEMGERLKKYIKIE